MCMYMDHNMFYTVGALKEKILNQLLCNVNKYSPYYAGSAGEMVDELEAYFATRNYQLNVVDLLIRITGDCLDLQYIIFEKNHGVLHIVSEKTPSKESKLVHLVYSSEHYSAVAKCEKSGNTSPLSSHDVTEDTSSHSTPFTRNIPIDNEEDVTPDAISPSTPLTGSISIDDEDHEDYLTELTEDTSSHSPFTRTIQIDNEDDNEDD